MSPFANTPHLWLTSHLNRLVEIENATKIQAVCRGFLVRRRQERHQSAEEFILQVIRKFQTPAPTATLKECLERHGLSVWAEGLPTAEEGYKTLEAGKRRQEAIWHASITLRLKGQGELVEELERADYHECQRVLSELRTPTPPAETAATDTLWQRLQNLWK